MHPPQVSTVLAGLAVRESAAVGEWNRGRLGQHSTDRPMPRLTGRDQPANYVLQFGPDPDCAAIGAVTVLVPGTGR